MGRTACTEPQCPYKGALYLPTSKFRVKHTCGVDNVVADVLSRIFEGDSSETAETNFVALLL